MALISLYSYLLLVKTKFVVTGSFGGKPAEVITMDRALN
jgi:solute carrier family 36 (proton-coupled amino acid transporter)